MTDNLSIILLTVGETGKIVLSKSTSNRNKFERGQVDVFQAEVRA